MIIDYKKMEQLMDCYEFEILVNEDLTLSLNDLQGGNLGGIESEKFNDFKEILDRMDSYHYDYIVANFEEEVDYKYKDWNDLADYLKSQSEWYEEWKWDIDMLKMITGGII